MKILFITDLYPIKREDENSPHTLHNFVIEWINQGHRVDIIKPNFIFNSFLRKKPFYKTGFYELDGVKIFNVNYHCPFLFNVEDKLDKSFDIKSYDKIISHMPSGNIFASKLAKKYNIPLVCGIHCSDLEVLANPLYRIYFKTKLLDALEKSEKIACRSHIIQNKLLDLYPEFKNKTFICSSGVNPDLITERKADFSSPIKVLACANLKKRKNIDKLILAMNELEGFELEVIGDGEELAKLKKISSDKVKFIGRLTHQAVLNHMQKSDIFILPSVNETFGMVYLEAMASGCITVCTKEDGIDGIIVDSKNGFLTQPTVEGIRETLLRIKQFENINLIQQQAQDTVKKLTSEAVASEYLKNI